MSDLTVKRGDTWPPPLLTIYESCSVTDPARYPNPSGSGFVKRVDFFTSPPDLITFIAKLDADTITGAMENVEVADGSSAVGTTTNVEPGLGVPSNRGQVRYPFSADDLSAIAVGMPFEVKVTWDSASTPPKIETFPNESTRNPSLDIDPDLGS